MNEHLSDMQQALLDTFKAFVEYCEKQHIVYYAAFGTLLGAVRHKGFIPWDDDIDVYMKRDDYDRFIKQRDALDVHKFGICDILDGESPYPFAKFYSKKGTIWEYQHFPFVVGPWIDVFPLDEGTPGSVESTEAYKQIHNVLWKYRKALAYVPLNGIWSDVCHHNFMDVVINITKKVRYAPFRKKYLKEIACCLDHIKKIKGEALLGYMGAMNNAFLEKSWFEKIEKIPFEDTEIMVPCGYHEILTLWYGDYMTLPPVKNRKPTHGGFYTDLTRTRSIKELQKDPDVLKRDKNHMSLKTAINEIKRRKGFSLKK